MIYRLEQFQRLPIRWQIGALLVVTQLVAHLIVWGIFIRAWTGSHVGPIAVATDVVAPLVAVVRLINLMPAEEGKLVEAAVASDSRLTIMSDVSKEAEDGLNDPSRMFLKATRASVPQSWQGRIVVSRIRGWAIWPSTIEFYVAAQLSSGKWLAFSPSSDSIWRSLPPLFGLFAVLLLALPLAAVALWVGTTVVAPLERLAAATKQFSRDFHAAPATESGPSEVRSAAKIFNEMRDRIRTSMEGRSRTLAAIGHDLRTPLTRIKLRIETLDDEVIRERLLIDVSAMETMVNSALSYIRGQHVPSEVDAVDLAALTATVCFDFADQGHEVTYHGPDRLVIRCDPDLVRRALTNVIDNGIKYAGEAVVRLGPYDDHRVRVTVEDHGPGIPERERGSVFEPFHRGDAARSNDGTAGFGLGLSIAKEIIERHGGSLLLSENVPHGLLVAINLPRST